MEEVEQTKESDNFGHAEESNIQDQEEEVQVFDQQIVNKKTKFAYYVMGLFSGAAFIVLMVTLAFFRAN